jgi:hypothetical protein
MSIDALSRRNSFHTPVGQSHGSPVDEQSAIKVHEWAKQALAAPVTNSIQSDLDIHLSDEQYQVIGQQLSQALDHEIQNQDLDEPNIYVRLAQLYAQVSIVLDKMMRQGKSLTELDRSYLDETKQAAKLTKKIGRAAPIMSAISMFIVVVAEANFPGDAGKGARDLAMFFANQFPQLKEGMTAGWSQEQQCRTGAATSYSQQYSSKSSKNDEQTGKQEYLKLLESIAQSFLSASRAS